jgi:hypothetical protein
VTTLEHILFKIAKFTKGNYNSPTGRYEKRVHHDQLVPKDTFQDCYAQLKDRYKHWVQLWGASDDAAQDCKHGGMTTDPQKHVFEDIAIATFLICLWRQSEGPKPRFVDLGCGNGFLVHLLAMEGFHGYGFDIAKRKIWFDSIQLIMRVGICMEKRRMCEWKRFTRCKHPLRISWTTTLKMTAETCG